VHGRRRGQRDLRSTHADGAQEREFIDGERMRAANLARRVGRGEIDLLALLVAKFEQRRNSPSVVTLSPISSCTRTTARMQSS
jgi:hypothetical protein